MFVGRAIPGTLRDYGRSVRQIRHLFPGGNDFIDQAESLGLVRGHEIVAVAGFLHHVKRLTGVLGKDFVA